MSPLVDIDWLHEHAGDPDVRIADVRWYLSGRRGADEYAKGHLPGAVFVDLDVDLAAPRGSGPGRHALPAADVFARTLARLGIGAATTVVAYDDVGGAIAARLWWLLRWFGHGGGRVLDGGIQAWTAAGLSLSTEEPHLAPAALLDLTPGHAPLADRLRVEALRSNPEAVLIDARARERFDGTNEPIDPRPGHVPGAKNAPFVENLIAPGGRFLSRDELAARYRELGALDAREVVAYCGSGVTACHDLIALTVAGREDVALYVGSFSEWSADPGLPVARGKGG